MTIHVTAVPAPTTGPEIEQLHEKGITRAAIAGRLDETYDRIGTGTAAVRLHVDTGVTAEGATVTGLQFTATGRYTLDGTRYVTGDGITLNYDSLLDVVEAALTKQ